jgi:hypothetical protein
MTGSRTSSVRGPVRDAGAERSDSGSDPRAPALAAVGVGVPSGLVAGLVMIATLIVAAALVGVPTAEPGVRTTGWSPLNAITAFIFGPENFGPGYRMASYAAFALHMLVAGLLGLRAPIAPAAALGLAYGLALQVLMLNLFVDGIQEVDTVYTSAAEWASWLGHALYGVALASLGGAIRASVAVEAVR